MEITDHMRKLWEAAKWLAARRLAEIVFPLKRQNAIAILAVVILEALPWLPAKAESIFSQDGNWLLQQCDGQELHQATMCLGYMSGVVEGLRTQWVISTAQAKASRTTPPRKSFCIPDGVDFLQVRDVVLKQLRDQPESRHHPASLLASFALTKAFPCRK